MTQTSKRAQWMAYDASPKGIERHARNNAMNNPTRSTINGIRTTRAAHIMAGRIIPTEDDMALHPITGNRMSYETLDAVADFNATRKTIDGFRTTTKAHIAAGRLPPTVPGMAPVEQKHDLEIENDKLLPELDAYKAMLYKGADAAYDTYRDRQGWTNFIYVVIDHGSEYSYSKIGVSYSPSKRVPDTDTWNPSFDPETVFKFPLEGLTYQEAKDFERSLHNRLAQWGRIRFAKNGKLSEWFKITPETAEIVIRSHWNLRRT